MAADGVATTRSHIPQLDGWRGVSIVAVLTAHLLPLGPKSWALNHAAALFGMSLFFTLSGFLITSFLLERPDVKSFLVRRLFRIVPLAWLVLLVCAPWIDKPPWLLQASFLFYQNYFHEAASSYTSHFWSLCVEMHFYLAVAGLVAVGGARSLSLLPGLGLAVTALRVFSGVPESIETHFRVDEILAGATLALILAGKLPSVTLAPLRHVPFVASLLLLLLACHERTRPVQYLRPYAAALLVGSTLARPEHWLSRRLGGRALKYLAEISYALYLIHGPLRSGWFGEGSTAVKYLFKRPLTLALTFVLAHLSTRHFEAYFIAWAKRLTTRRPARDLPAPAE